MPSDERDPSMPSVSVVVPTLNAASTIGVCLESIARQTYAAVSVTVVDSRSSDPTPTIVQQLGAHLIDAASGRSKARNVGAAMTTGEFILFIDADMELTRCVVQRCVELATIHEADALIIPETNSGTGFWARCLKFEKLVAETRPMGEAPRFFRRSAFAEAGGFSEDLEAGEDFDLYFRLLDLGAVVKRVDCSITHHIAQTTLRGIAKKYKYYGKWNRAFRSRNQKALASQGSYLTHLRKQERWLVEDPLHFAGFLLLKLVERLAVD